MKNLLFAFVLAFMAALMIGGVAVAQVDEDTLEDAAATEEAAETTTDESTVDEVGDELDEISPIETWELLAGIIIPLIVGAINRQGWTVQYKNGALFAVSAVMTAIGLYFQGDLDQVEDWVTTLMTLALMSYATYNTLWQFLPLPQRIEAATGGDPIATSKYLRSH